MNKEKECPFKIFENKKIERHNMYTILYWLFMIVCIAELPV